MYDQFAVYVKDVVKKYRKQTILDELKMTVEKGTIYGLLGSSGCGKTTILTCIVGRKKIDKGEIWLLGKEAGGVPGRKVGYMPQETALVGEFTVKDAIFYFGRIYHMKERDILHRYRRLHKLLDLPPDGSYIKNCSGGQQRRVSFAVALVHEPQLLILDEPSVGADPIIRDRIWSYLKEIAVNEKTTVIVTTHYIEETRQADKVGLLREGKLLVEDAPDKLLSNFNTETLEDVFLILSRKQEQRQLENVNLNYNNSKMTNADKQTCSSGVIGTFEIQDHNHQHKKIKIVKKNKNNNPWFSTNRMKALLNKNLKQVYRNPLSAAFLVISPFTQMLLFLAALGRNINDIPFGIVNREMGASCYDLSTNGSVISEHKYCHFNKLSCIFLDHFNDDMIEKKYYGSILDAKEDVKRGKLVGAMLIGENFTSFLEQRINEGLFVNSESQNEVSVWMDMSNYQLGGVVRYKIADLYSQFQEAVFVDCEFPTQASGSPIRVEEYIYGNVDEPFIIFMTPGMVLTVLYFFGIMMTSTIVITEKCEGIWDRSIVAGVTSLELSLSHLMLQATLLAFMVLETMVVIFAIFRQEYIGSIWIIFFILYIQGICGLVCGFWVSVISNNHVMANIITSGFFNTAAVCGGIFWPIQAMPTVLRIISYCFPFAIPTESLRNVIKKGWGLDNLQVLNGVGILLGWTLFFGAFSVLLIKISR